MKIYITGHDGMLGGYCSDKLSADGYEIVCPSREELDLAFPDRCFKSILKESPDIILHLAAETNVDLCERDPVRAYKYNSKSTECIARAASQLKAKIIYISTSNVFGYEGRQCYNELDIPYPINYYGKSKLAGEVEVKNQSGGNYLILRAGWMIGGGKKKDHKFVGKIMENISKKIDQISAVDDKYGSVTYALTLSNFISLAIKCDISGLYHVASSGIVSRYQIAAYIARIMHYSGEIRPVKSAMFPLSAPRPDFESIDSIESGELFAGLELGSWEDALNEYLKEFV